jgi:hypothetical protein
MSQRSPSNIPGRYIDEKVAVQKLVPDAVFPHKEHDSTDVTYEINVSGRTDNRAEDDLQEVNNFSTGLVITPPVGLYVQIIPHPDLHKHGYSLIRNPMLIQPGNTAELIIPLYKFKETEDLELPFPAVQMVVHRAVYAHIYDIGVSIKRQERLDSYNGGYGGGYGPPGPQYGQPSPHTGYRQDGPPPGQMRNYAPSGPRSGASGKSHMF